MRVSRVRASLLFRSGAPVTADTAFLLASISKIFLGAAVAKLIDEGKVQLDDDIKDTLPADWARYSCFCDRSACLASAFEHFGFVFKGPHTATQPTLTSRLHGGTL